MNKQPWRTTEEANEYITKLEETNKILLNALKLAFRYGQFEDAEQLRMIGEAISRAEEN